MPTGLFAPLFSGGSGGTLTPNGATQITSFVSTNTAFSAPTGAMAFLLEAKDSNPVNLRWVTGAVGASTSFGQQMQPGRDSSWSPFGGTLAVCPETVGSTCEIELTWLTFI